MQFKAGYIVDSIAKVVTDYKAKLDKHIPADQTKLDQINGLLQYMSSFDVEFPYEHSPDFKNLNPVLATLNNIITRGLPTRAPIILENILSEIKLTEPNQDEFELNYPKSTKPIFFESIFELLHVIEPNLKIDKKSYAGNPESNLEWEFLKKHPFLIQILESQRDFSTINNKLAGGRRVDFCFTSPYLKWDINLKKYINLGRIIEIDGHNSHFLSEGKFYDKYRDKLAEVEGFNTIRETAIDIMTDKTNFEALFGRIIYKIFEENYKKKIEDYIIEYYLIFMPIAVARIQKTLIELLIYKKQYNPDFFKKDKIKIAIIERDFACGAIAIESLKEMVANINALLTEESKLNFPEIELAIFEEKKWFFHNKLHLQADRKDENYFNQNEFDIILDHSILRRSNIYNESDYVKDNVIKIRSSHYYNKSFGKSRRVYCADLLHYHSLVNINDDGTYNPKEVYKENINYFIQNIFRKVSFREGQLPIISRALQQKPVIGLLPTGGGKSLTYQLPTFLQPGLCLVVDPIKSLMEDQVRVLKQNWIDCCEYINSNIKREERNQKIINFRYGEAMFLFVSPERLAIQEFRNLIQRIDSSDFGLAFSYCVIDEVHCVSEWGHDFRTTYLMLGKNSQKFAKTKSGNDVSLIGLTATASFDVLTDIERELSITSEDVNNAVISIDNTIRPELFFSVVENETKAATFPVLSQSLKDTIGFAKQSQINKHIEGIIEKLNSINDEVVTKCLKQHFDDFELNINFDDENQKEYIDKVKNSILKQTEIKDFNDVISVIFCPHTTGTFGITNELKTYPSNKEIFENLVLIPIENKGYFMGGDDKINQAVIENAQKYFLQFMQGRINYMVCTKAFGMGIDKEHIRSIYHLNFSSSPESYIQEAGRAGRDKAKAICSIFFDRNIYYTISHNYITENNPQNFQLIADRKKARELFEDYNSSQNRISEKYYGDITSLTQNFKNIGVELDKKYILPFNQDLSIHEYFHSNSFKGIETELFQLNRFINYKEGINTTQLKLSQEKYNIEFDDDINLNLTLIGNFQGNMLINNSKGNAIGKIFSANTNPTVTINGLPARQEPDLIKSQQVLDFLVEEWNNNGKTEPLLFNFLKKEIIEGLNNGLSLVECFEKSEPDSFWFKVQSSFNNNNLEDRIVNDFNLKSLAIFNNHNNTEDFLNTLKKYSANFEDFILRIEEQWDVNIIPNPIYIQNRDEYRSMYYSEINNADVSKMIYRLYSIGLVEDYTIDYNLGLFSFEVLKRDKKYYIDKTRNHLLKYLSRTVTLKKIEVLTNLTLNLSTFDTIKKCVKEILLFTYDDIVKKREDAVNDLFKFISESLDISKQRTNNLAFHDFWYNHHFKDEMYYYFNAKYARVGFKIGNEPYSLLDDTEKGQISNWETFEKYAVVLNEQSSFISECKMMRGSCKRIWRSLSKVDSESEFVLKILYAFSTFGLNNEFYYDEAQENLIKGFLIYYRYNNNYEIFKIKFARFEELIFQNATNNDFTPYLEYAKQHIMLLINIEFTKEIYKQIQDV